MIVVELYTLERRFAALHQQKSKCSQLFPTSNTQINPRTFRRAVDFLSLFQRNALLSRLARGDLQLPEHHIPRLFHQIINVFLRLSLCHDRARDSHRNGTRTEALPPHIENIAVIRDRDGDNGNLRLHGQVESTLFEREEVGVVVVAARAFGENVDGLAVLVHLLCGFVESGDGLRAGFTFDEDGFAESHWMKEVVLAKDRPCKMRGAGKTY
jgi:hypothetical protein